MYLDKEKLDKILKGKNLDQRGSKTTLWKTCYKSGLKIALSHFTQGLNGNFSFTAPNLQILCKILGIKKEEIS